MDRGYVHYAKFASLGVSWVLTTAIMLYIGFRAGTWLDARWGTDPFMTALCLFGASILALVFLVKEAWVLLERPVGTQAPTEPPSTNAEGPDVKPTSESNRQP